MLKSTDIKIGDKVKLNHEGTAYLIDRGFLKLYDTVTIESIDFRDGHYYFTTEEAGFNTEFMIGEFESIIED